MKNLSTTIDPALISLLGRKLYSGEPIVICVRELLQNSVDACKTAGVIPQISISVKQLANREWQIICDDNGCGMTESDILDKFLCLGRSGKSEGVGGFGIAKAAILSGKRWLVWTKDSFFSNKALEAGEEIQKAKYRQGTRILVVQECESYSESSMLSKIKNLIMSSNVNVDLKIKARFSDEIHIQNAGFDYAGLTPHLHSAEAEWSGYTVSIPEIVSDEVKKLGGRVYVRIQGLTQFTISVDIPSDKFLLVDVDTTFRPSERKYPFDLSREKLSSDISAEVNGWANQFVENNLSAFVIASSYMEPKFLSGYIETGRNKLIRDILVSQLGGTASSFETAISMGTGEDVPQRLRDRYDPRKHNPIIEYDPEYEVSPEDMRIIGIYNRMIKQMLPEGLRYTLVCHSPREPKSGSYQGGTVSEFGINPSVVRNMTVVEKLFSLFFTATHEVAHVASGNHNEVFTVTQGILMRHNSEWFHNNLINFAGHL